MSRSYSIARNGATLTRDGEEIRYGNIIACAEDVIPELAAGHRVIVFDNEGVGQWSAYRAEFDGSMRGILLTPIDDDLAQLALEQDILFATPLPTLE